MRLLIDALRRKRQWVLWAAAAGFGIVGVAGTQGFIAEQLEAERTRLQGEHAPVRVLVAGADLQPGTRIDAGSLAVRELPARYVSASAIGEADYDQVEGQVLRVAMRAGEPVLATAIDAPEPGFSDRVRPGIRAMTILVDEVNSVSGMLRPGDRIDLVFSAQAPGATANAGEITTPLMQDLRVLATGKEASDTSFRRTTNGAFTAITVEVSPDQAQKLVLAQRSGRLTALLRNPDDRNPLPARPLDVFSLLGIERPVGVATTRSIEVIVGGQGAIDQNRESGRQVLR